MREIKFRAWDDSTKEMVYQTDSFFSLSAGKILDRYSIVMQFTGSKDKNSKEIYEVDILNSTSGNKFIVVFNNGCFMLQHIKDEYPGEYLYEGASSFWIIGNIYQNPELVK